MAPKKRKQPKAVPASERTGPFGTRMVQTGPHSWELQPSPEMDAFTSRMEPKLEAEARLFAELNDPPLRGDEPLDVRLERAITMLGHALELLRPPFVLPTQRARRVEELAQRTVEAMREKIDDIEWTALESWIEHAALDREASDPAGWAIGMLAQRYPSLAGVVADYHRDDLQRAILARRKGRGRKEVLALRLKLRGEPVPVGEALKRAVAAEKKRRKRRV